MRLCRRKILVAPTILKSKRGNVKCPCPSEQLHDCYVHPRDECVGHTTTTRGGSWLEGSFAIVGFGARVAAVGRASTSSFPGSEYGNLFRLERSILASCRQASPRQPLARACAFSIAGARLCTARGQSEVAPQSYSPVS